MQVDLALTTIFFITAIWTVLKAIAPEAANDTMDPTSTGEERGATFGFGFCCKTRNTKKARIRETICRRLKHLPNRRI